MNNQNEPIKELSRLSLQVKAFLLSAVANINKAYTVARTEKNTVAAILSAAYAALTSAVPLLYYFAALILSSEHIVIGTYPLGIAFLASSGRWAPMAYAGTLTAALIFSDSVAVDIAVYTLVLCLRRLTVIFIDSHRRIFDFEDKLRVKMAVSTIGGAVLGAYQAINADFSLASLFAFLLYVILTPTLTFLYSAVTAKQGINDVTLYKQAGAAALVVSLVAVLRNLTLLGINVAVAAAMLMTICAAKRYGTYKSVIFGLFMGLILPPSLMPVFALAAITSGILFSASPYIATAASSLAALSWAIYAGGYIIATAVAPSFLLGGVLAAVVMYSDILTAKPSEKADTVPAEAILLTDRLRREDTDALLHARANAFSGLSDMLYRLSDRICRPSFFDVKEVIADGKRKICRRCKKRDFCYTEHEGETEDAWDKVAVKVANNGILRETDVPPFLSDNCRHVEELCCGINEAYAELLRSLIDTDKTEIMAFDYGAISSVLSGMIAERQVDYEIDHKLSQKLAAHLREHKIHAKRVCIFGNRKKTVFISDLKLSQIHIGEDDLRRLTSDVCGGEFSSPEFELKGGSINATMRSEASFSVIFQKRQSTKSESSACGDSAMGFPCREDRYCALISDGMGSGREAALTSGMCALFIEKMMSAGNSASVTLQMLNSMIRAKGAECSASVDMLDFDLLTGQAHFIKSGAAPSYIVRGGEVFRIDSKTIPVGLIRSLDAEETTVRTEVGDIIVMVSDGVAEDDRDSVWLCTLLSDVCDRGTADTADLIIKEAERRLQKKDDATVCVIRVASSAKTNDVI